MEKAPVNIQYLREVVSTIIEHILSWAWDFIDFLSNRNLFFLLLPFVIAICIFGIKNIMYLIHSSR